MRPRLNLATKPIESHRRFLVGTGLSICVAAVAFLVLGWHVYAIRAAAKEVRLRTQQIRQESAKAEAQQQELQRYFAQKNIASIHDRAAFINSVIMVRSFNWTQMFMDLERILPPGARVINIEPTQVAGHVEVKLTFATTNDEVKLQFMHALQTSQQFSNLEEIREGEPTSSGNPSGDRRVVQIKVFYSGT